MMRAQAILSGLWLASVAAITPAMAEPPAPAPYHAVGRIAGSDGGWDFSALDATSGRLYIARTDAVSVADIASGSITTLAPAHKGHQVLVLDHGATVFQTDGASGLARFIDAHSGAILAEIPVGTDPDAALFDYATGLVTVMNATAPSA
jgi:DNA-binding beta-propeller fold protein YncE